MNFKKSLAKIVLTTALTLGTLGLTGCSNIFSTENQVYNYINKFSKKIPKNFIKTDQVYHDKDIEIRGSWIMPEIKSGKGRVVIYLNNEYRTNMIIAGYADSAELKLKDPNEIKNLKAFSRIINLDKKIKEFDEILILLKNKNAIVYLKKDNEWKKSPCQPDNFKLCYENLMQGEIIAEKHVQKYINLAKRLENTYFKEN